MNGRILAPVARRAAARLARRDVEPAPPRAAARRASRPRGRGAARQRADAAEEGGRGTRARGDPRRGGTAPARRAPAHHLLPRRARRGCPRRGRARSPCRRATTTPASRALADAMNDEPTMRAVRAERAFLAGARGRLPGADRRARRPDGRRRAAARHDRRRRRARAWCAARIALDATEPALSGIRLANQLRGEGASEILEGLRRASICRRRSRSRRRRQAGSRMRRRPRTRLPVDSSLSCIYRSCHALASPTTARAGCAAPRRCAPSCARRIARAVAARAAAVRARGHGRARSRSARCRACARRRSTRCCATRRAAAEAGVGGVLLFGIPEHKDAEGIGAWDDEGPVQQAVRALKQRVAAARRDHRRVHVRVHRSHGHCGVLRDGEVDNDATLELLAREALSHARAGADIVAPSDMMDGRVGAIRRALDEAGFASTSILSYAAKFASAFYGPFREAAESDAAVGRPSRLSDGRRATRTKRCARCWQDIEEGADMVMVKPAGPFLDVIAAREGGDGLSARRVPGERRVRYDSGGRRARLDRSRAGDDGVAARHSPRGRGRHHHVFRDAKRARAADYVGRTPGTELSAA